MQTKMMEIVGITVEAIRNVFAVPDEGVAVCGVGAHCDER